MSTDVETIRARRAAVTSGPWMVSGHIVPIVVTLDFEPPREIGEALSVNDAEFIAHAPEDIDMLLARVSELETRIDRALSTFGPDRSLPLGRSRWRSADHWLRAIRAHLRGEDAFDPAEEMHAEAMRREKGE